jgi:hypothetical protein
MDHQCSAQAQQRNKNTQATLTGFLSSESAETESV